MTATDPGITIKVQREDFDIGAELAALSDGDTSVGGVASFTGLVRDMAPGSTPAQASMTLEHYPGMAEAEIMRICRIAAERWGIALAVEHVI